MARNSLSSRFRRLDIDQFDENRFVEEPDGADTGTGAGALETDGGPGPEVEAALRQYPLSGGWQMGRETPAPFFQARKDSPLLENPFLLFYRQIFSSPPSDYT